MSKKERILEAALNLAEERDSFPQFTISDVAMKADIGKGTVYEYFTSKEHLLDEMRLYYINHMIEAIENAVVAPGSFKEKLRAFFTQIPLFNTQGNYVFTRVRILMSLFSGTDCEKNKEIVRRSRETFAKLLDAGTADNSIEQSVNYVVAFSAFATAMLMILVWHKNPAGMTYDNIIDLACDQVIKLLNV